MVRNECLRFGVHVDIQASYKILWLEYQKRSSFCTNRLTFKRAVLRQFWQKKTPVGVKHSSGLALWPFSCGKQPMLNEGFQKEDALFVNLGEKNWTQVGWVAVIFIDDAQMWVTCLVKPWGGSKPVCQIAKAQLHQRRWFKAYLLLMYVRLWHFIYFKTFTLK
jgi:hypothetical protein